jgi:hypothetical protein
MRSRASASASSTRQDPARPDADRVADFLEKTRNARARTGDKLIGSKRGGDLMMRVTLFGKGFGDSPEIEARSIARTARTLGLGYDKYGSRIDVLFEDTWEGRRSINALLRQYRRPQVSEPTHR